MVILHTIHLALGNNLKFELVIPSCPDNTASYFLIIYSSFHFIYHVVIPRLFPDIIVLDFIITNFILILKTKAKFIINNSKS